MATIMASRSAIVVGAGIIGLTCAYRLQRHGFRTLLVDRHQPVPPASWGNAGHLAVEQTRPMASRETVLGGARRLFLWGGPLGLPARDVATWLPFMLRFVSASAPRQFAAGQDALTTSLAEAVPAWRRLCGDLDRTDLLAEDGHFVLWETSRSAEKGVAAWRRHPGETAAFRPVSAEERARLEELVSSPFDTAVRFSRSGQIRDLGALRSALLSRFTQEGGQYEECNTARLVPRYGRPALEITEGEIREADALVVAAGIGSAPLLEDIGLEVPLIAERGYHIEGPATGWPADMPPVVFEDRAMIATRFAETLRLASFVEFARADAPPDPRKWRRLRHHAAELGLPLDEPLTEWMGARPTLPDYLPAIGRSDAMEGLYYAFGHQHLGLTLAALTGEAISAMVTGGTSRLNLAPFDLDRFSKPRKKEASA